MMMGAFIVALLGMIGAATYFILEQNKLSEKRNKALALITGGRTDTTAQKIKEKDKSNRADITKKLKTGTLATGEKINKKSIKILLMQAGWRIGLLQFWMLSFMGASVFTLLVELMWHNPVMTAGAGIMGFLGLPRLIVTMKIAARQKAFLNEFADALEAMARLLKAGMPVGEAIAMCAREYTGPVGAEMRRMYDAQKMGVPLSEAAYEAALRMPVAEMRMLATALTIQQQTGSSLSEVLENLAGTIRARHRLKRKIQALSSEAKVSAMIIGALPLLVMGALQLVNPKYLSLLFQPGLGEILLYSAGFWMFCGVMVMRQMINFKI